MLKQRKTTILFTFLVFSVPYKIHAGEIGFSYIEGGFIGGFVNDIETSQAVAGNALLDLESDADGGGFIGSAWQLGENMHLFGEYASLGQELEVTNDLTTIEGEYSVVRWRIGIAYQHSVSENFTYYARLSLDTLELKDADAPGIEVSINAEDSGVGSEIGLVWKSTQTFHLQAHARYTAVGGVANNSADPFEADVLIGANLRWHFRDNIALIAGYEYGKITTFNAGVRFSF